MNSTRIKYLWNFNHSKNTNWPYNVMESQLFAPTLYKIMCSVLSVIEKYKYKVHDFYVHGKFGQFEHVHHKIISAIENCYLLKGLKCVCLGKYSPANPFSNGSVMWRRDLPLLSNKVYQVNATYEIEVTIPFDSKIHDEYYRIYNAEEDEYQCHSVFTVFLEKGELSLSNEVITTSIIPSSQIFTRLYIDICSTPNLGVQYTKNKNGKSTVEKIKELMIDIPNPDKLPQEQRIINITMDFRGLEIQVKTFYRVTGKGVTTIVCM